MILCLLVFLFTCFCVRNSFFCFFFSKRFYFSNWWLLWSLLVTTSFVCVWVNICELWLRKLLSFGMCRDNSLNVRSSEKGLPCFLVNHSSFVYREVVCVNIFHGASFASFYSSGQVKEFRYPRYELSYAVLKYATVSYGCHLLCLIWIVIFCDVERQNKEGWVLLLFLHMERIIEECSINHTLLHVPPQNILFIEPTEKQVFVQIWIRNQSQFLYWNRNAYYLWVSRIFR